MIPPETGEYFEKTPQGYPSLPWTLTTFIRSGGWKRLPGVRIVFVFSVLSSVLLLAVHAVGVKGRWFVPAAVGYLLFPGIYQILFRFLENPAVTIRVTSSEVQIVNHDAGMGIASVATPISSVRAVSETGDRQPPDAFCLASEETPPVEFRIGNIRDPSLYEAMWRYFSQDPAVRLPLQDLVATSEIRTGSRGKKWSTVLGWGLMILLIILWDVYEKMMER